MDRLVFLSFFCKIILIKIIMKKIECIGFHPKKSSEIFRIAFLTKRRADRE